jgi:hypothetical protein
LLRTPGRSWVRRVLALIYRTRLPFTQVQAAVLKS